MSAMGGIHCNNCGAELDEAPTLLPDQRPPCPRCGSLARRFEQDITDQITLSDSGTCTDTFTITKTVGFDAVVVAATAEGVGEALPPTLQTIHAIGVPSAAEVGTPTVTQGPPVVRDR
jgi:hypothetical protein